MHRTAVLFCSVFFDVRPVAPGVLVVLCMWRLFTPQWQVLFCAWGFLTVSLYIVMILHSNHSLARNYWTDWCACCEGLGTQHDAGNSWRYRHGRAQQLGCGQPRSRPVGLQTYMYSLQVLANRDDKLEEPWLSSYARSSAWWKRWRKRWLSALVSSRGTRQDQTHSQQPPRRRLEKWRSRIRRHRSRWRWQWLESSFLSLRRLYPSDGGGSERFGPSRHTCSSRFRVGSCWVFIANTFFSPHQQSVLQGTTFRPGCPSHFQVSNFEMAGATRSKRRALQHWLLVWWEKRINVQLSFRIGRNCGKQDAWGCGTTMTLRSSSRKLELNCVDKEFLCSIVVIFIFVINSN